MKKKQRIFTQEEFRSFLKCPRFYSYGGKVSFSPEIEIIEALFERVCSLYLKNQSYDLNNLYSDGLVIVNRYNKQHKLLESQYNKLLNSVIIFLNEVFTHLNIFDMYPVYGPILLNKPISKSIIKIKSSGVFRAKNQTLHLVLFSPYKTRLNVLNDPIVHFLNESFRDFVKGHKSKRPKVIVNIFYYKKETELGYIRYKPNLKTRNYLQEIVKLESTIFNPVLPCNYSCNYRNKCEKENYEL